MIARGSRRNASRCVRQRHRVPSEVAPAVHSLYDPFAIVFVCSCRAGEVAGISDLNARLPNQCVVFCRVLCAAYIPSFFRCIAGITDAIQFRVAILSTMSNQAESVVSIDFVEEPR